MGTVLMQCDQNGYWKQGTVENVLACTICDRLWHNLCCTVLYVHITEGPVTVTNEAQLKHPDFRNN
jgi:hypothetical protein